MQVPYMSAKKIVVTGASGFLGSHLVERLKDNESYCVFAMSSHPDELKVKIGGSNVHYLYKDVVIDGGDVLEEAIVINCAFPRNATGVEVGDGLKYIQGVFEAAVENKALAIINISSQSVYSQQRTEAATEDTPVCLENSYAVGKYAVELMLESICKGSRTVYTNLRMASLIGPGFNQRIVNRFAIKLLRGENITVVKQPKKMGFLDVEDAVNAILAVAETSMYNWKPIYNVGNGHGYTVEEIFSTVAMEMKDQIEIAQPIYEVGTDVSSTAVAFDSLNRDTGFIPVIGLNESIKRIVACL